MAAFCWRRFCSALDVFGALSFVGRWSFRFGWAWVLGLSFQRAYGCFCLDLSWEIRIIIKTVIIILLCSLATEVDVLEIILHDEIHTNLKLTTGGKFKFRYPCKNLIRIQLIASNLSWIVYFTSLMEDELWWKTDTICITMQSRANFQCQRESGAFVVKSIFSLWTLACQTKVISYAVSVIKWF